MTDHPILNLTDINDPAAYPAITAAAANAEWDVLGTRLERCAAEYRAAPSVRAIEELEGTLHAILRAPRAILDLWRQAEPQNGWAWLVPGMADTYAGLEARGEETADMLTEAEWEEVTALLTGAGTMIDEALRLGVQPGPALSALGQGATVMGADDAGHTSLLRKLVAHDPNWLPGWSSALARSETRWGGSNAAMEDILSLAETHMAAPEMQRWLQAEYWWWRANWDVTVEGDPGRAQGHLGRGLEADPPPAMRARLLALNAQILQSAGADEAAIAAAWEQAVAAAPNRPDHMFDFALSLVATGDTGRATEVLARLAEDSGPEGPEAANWLGRQLARGGRGFLLDRAAAQHWFRKAAARGPEGKVNLAEQLFAEDPTSSEAMDLCHTALDEGLGHAALPLAKAYLERGAPGQAEEVLRIAAPEYSACHYALARGLDEGWFGPADPARALAVSDAVLPVAFDPYLSLLHMTLLSTTGDWKATRAHGDWLQSEMAEGNIDLPEPLQAELARLLAAIPGSGLGGMLKRMGGRERLRLETDPPDIWAA